MKAVIKEGPGPGLVLRDVPVPVPGAGEVLVKVKAASVCGTDVLIHDWSPWAAGRMVTPRIIGHEFAGEVIEAGPGVEDIPTGMRVSAESHYFCGKCRQCRTGSPEVCRDLKIMGVDADGSFAEYLSVPAVNLWPNPAGMPDDLASLQEPLGNAVDTVNSEDISGKDVLITGAGPMGLMCVAVARACGASNIIVSDPNEYRLGLASMMGADIVIDPIKQSLHDVAMSATAGNGVDVFLEISGKAEALAAGLRLLAPAGRVSLLGIFHGPVPVDLNKDVIFKKARIYGITGRRPFSTWKTVSELLSSGRLDLSPLITHELSLGDFEEGFHLMESGRCGKVVFRP